MVADQAGFSVGDFVTLDPSTKIEEVVQIVGFGSLILKNKLQHGHAAGAVIKKNLPVTISTTPMPVDNSNKKLPYIIAIVVALIFCVVFILCAIAHLGKKRKTRKRGIDEIADREKMYDMEEPPGPTDSLIKSSPYMDPPTDSYTNGSGSVYMAVDAAPISLPPLIPSHMTIPPLVPSFRLPPLVPPRMPMVHATNMGYTTVGLQPTASLRLG